nr:putative ribonuclease H-like domain-containing protein [Tanacetum cinerariifolium]
IEAIRLFLAFASFIGFMVYYMDVKSAFLYGKIAEEVYVTQPIGFEDPDHPKKVYKVVKALYGLHQAPRACDYAGANGDGKSTTAYPKLGIWYPRDSPFDLEAFTDSDYAGANGDGKSTTGDCPLGPWDCLKEVSAACDQFCWSYVIPAGNVFFLLIFKYLTAYPKLGLWYPRDSPFDLKAFSDSDYASANGDRKSTTGGCQFLGRRGIESTWSMRLFERGFCCLLPILLVGMVFAGGHSILLVAVVSIHFCWSCDFLLVVPHSCW